MPCSDVTEIIRLRFDNGERLLSYSLNKKTCGGGVGAAALLEDYFRGRTSDEILALTPEAFVADRPGAADSSARSAAPVAGAGMQNPERSERVPERQQSPDAPERSERVPERQQSPDAPERSEQVPARQEDSDASDAEGATLEQFLEFKHFFAVQIALEVLTGRAPGGIRDRCVVAEVAYDGEELYFEADIPVDLPTERIQSCGLCKGCGSKKTARRAETQTPA